MSDNQEIHGAPLNSSRLDQRRIPWAATQLKAGVTVTSDWLLEELKGWHDRRIATRELSRALQYAVRGGRARYH